MSADAHAVIETDATAPIDPRMVKTAEFFASARLNVIDVEYDEEVQRGLVAIDPLGDMLSITARVTTLLRRACLPLGPDDTAPISVHSLRRNGHAALLVLGLDDELLETCQSRHLDPQMAKAAALTLLQARGWTFDEYANGLLPTAPLAWRIDWRDVARQLYEGATLDAMGEAAVAILKRDQSKKDT